MTSWTEQAPRPRAAVTWRTLGFAVAGVAITCGGMFFAPAVAEHMYTEGDGAACDLGSIGATISGALIAIAGMAAAVVAAAVALHRARVLLVLPCAVVGSYLATDMPLEGAVVSPCGEPYPVLGAVALAAGTGVLTYLLGRGAVARGADPAG